MTEKKNEEMLRLDLINKVNAIEVRAGHILWSGLHIVYSLVGDVRRSKEAICITMTAFKKGARRPDRHR